MAGEDLHRAVQDCLAQLGISRGDTLFLHSDAIVAAQFPGKDSVAKINALLDAIEEHLGREGTMVVPTFTYSFTKNEVFDRRSTPSAVGMITEVFRGRPGVVRNQDPIFSVATSGAGKDAFASANSFECFGSDSSFGLLHRKNGWIVGMGCALDRTTFVHYVEKSCAVNYRFEKIFSGVTVAENGEQQQASISYFVRDLEKRTETNLKRLRARLVGADRLRIGSLGRIQVWAVRAADFYDTAALLIRENPVALIEEGKE